VDFARKLIVLGLGQVGEVEDPVVVHTAVEAVFLALAVFNYFSFFVLFAWDEMWFSIAQTVIGRCLCLLCCLLRCCCSGGLAFLREGDAATAIATMLSLLM
jgi:hypothetical protein